MGNSWKCCHSKSERGQGYPLSLFLFNIVSKVLQGVIKECKKTKEVETAKEKIKIYSFADNMMLYMKKTNTTPKIC